MPIALIMFVLIDVVVLATLLAALLILSTLTVFVAEVVSVPSMMIELFNSPIYSYFPSSTADEYLVVYNYSGAYNYIPYSGVYNSFTSSFVPFTINPSPFWLPSSPF